MQKIVKITKISTIVLLLAVMVVLCFSLIDVVNLSKAEAEVEVVEIEYEEKIYVEFTLDDYFVDDCVLVIMDKAVGGMNVVHDISFFEGVDIVEVIDLMPISDSAIANGSVDVENFSQILQLVLAEPSKQNVLDAIDVLMEIDGIKYAGINRIMGYINGIPIEDYEFDEDFDFSIIFGS